MKTFWVKLYFDGRSVEEIFMSDDNGQAIFDAVRWVRDRIKCSFISNLQITDILVG